MSHLYDTELRILLLMMQLQSQNALHRLYGDNGTQRRNATLLQCTPGADVHYSSESGR